MHDAGERPELAQAILAHVSVSKEQPVGTNQPEVVQRLHDRHAVAPGRIVDRRRHQRKGVVEMGDVRLAVAAKLGDFSIRLAIPKGVDAAPPKGYPRDGVVIHGVAHHLVAEALEHLCLSLEDDVFPAGQLIEIVREQNSHGSHLTPSPSFEGSSAEAERRPTTAATSSRHRAGLRHAPKARPQTLDPKT
jgi:hypothetical protein